MDREGRDKYMYKFFASGGEIQRDVKWLACLMLFVVSACEQIGGCWAVYGRACASWRVHLGFRGKEVNRHVWLLLTTGGGGEMRRD